ncbi:MAG: corrinoid protein [Oscillospiraceae bacterium]|jgi:5-methyltetrahydrofolate--homocysteine methyltransferase|nr:corrinoid protein [Oscillospiraceae bacterium]
MSTEILANLSLAVQKGRAKDVEALIAQGLAEDFTAQQLLEDGLLTGMNLLGVRFKNNEVFVPEVLIAARALNKGTLLLKTQLVEEGVKPIGTVVIGTVQGDLHDIGKNLVRMMLEGSGFQVIDLGVDVAPETFVEAVREHKPQIVALSALLTTTMGSQRGVIEALEGAGLRGTVKVMIGGAPITEAYANEIGADAYTADAASAAQMAKSLVAA